MTTETLDALEVWKPVPGWEDSHEVSNLGRVRSLPRIGNRWKGRVLKTPATPKGYAQVNLCLSGLTEHVEVHRLVLLAFVGPCPDGMEACHFPDRDPANNRLDNLRWDTPAANSADQYTHNPNRGALCSQPGESNPFAKLTASDVRAIRAEYAGGCVTQKELGDRFGVTHSAISKIIRAHNWALETV